MKLKLDFLDMAKVFYVSYDLRGEERGYEYLIKTLTDMNAKNILKSVWSVRTKDDITCSLLKDELMKLIKKEDGIVVIEATDHSYYGLQTGSSELY